MAKLNDYVQSLTSILAKNFYCVQIKFTKQIDGSYIKLRFFTKIIYYNLYLGRQRGFLGFCLVQLKQCLKILYGRD